jgi:isopenicillin-N N-acyltransferase-like protein
MEQLLGGNDQLDMDDLEGVLRDHSSFPDSICRHPDLDAHQDQRYGTVVSMLIDLTAGRMLFAGGPPCHEAYAEIMLEG